MMIKFIAIVKFQDVFLSPTQSPAHTVGTGVDLLKTSPLKNRSPSFISLLRGDSTRSSNRPEASGGSRRRLVSEGTDDGSHHSHTNLVTDREALHNALRNTPFNKVMTQMPMTFQKFSNLDFCVFQYHQKHNPNLIDDDEQELETHLRRRHTTARRLSTIAMLSNAGVGSNLRSDQLSQSGLSEFSNLSLPGEPIKRTRHTSCEYI